MTTIFFILSFWYIQTTDVNVYMSTTATTKMIIGLTDKKQGDRVAQSA